MLRRSSSVWCTIVSAYLISTGLAFMITFVHPRSASVVRQKFQKQHLYNYCIEYTKLDRTDPWVNFYQCCTTDSGRLDKYVTEAENIFYISN